jgi:beta-fructofuranosidase
MFLAGDYDKKTHTFDRKWVQSIGYGLDYYAPQSLETPDGRRVSIAWMQNWATCHSQPEKVRWFGQMTLPRELQIRNDRVYQNPVRELENYRTNPVIHKNIPVSRETTLEGVNGRILDMTVTVRPGDDKGYRKFKMYFAKGGDCHSSVSFRPASGKVRMDRTFSGFAYDIVNNRSFLVDADKEVKIRVIMDRFSVELFFNDGAQTATMTLYTPQDCDGISFEAEGNVLMDVEKYDLTF